MREKEADRKGKEVITKYKIQNLSAAWHLRLHCVTIQESRQRGRRWSGGRGVCATKSVNGG